MRKFWTEEEMGILKHNCSMPTKKLIKLLPNRKLKCVDWKLRHLKLKRRKSSFRWTIDKINFLKLNYAIISNQKLANIIKCSIRTINSKSYELRLKKDVYTRISGYTVPNHFMKNKYHPLYQKVLKNINNNGKIMSNSTKEKIRLGNLNYIKRLLSSKKGRKMFEKRKKNTSEVKREYDLTHLHAKFKRPMNERLRKVAIENLKYANEARRLKSTSSKILKELREYQD